MIIMKIDRKKIMIQSFSDHISNWAKQRMWQMISF